MVSASEVKEESAKRVRAAGAAPARCYARCCASARVQPGMPAVSVAFSPAFHAGGCRYRPLRPSVRKASEQTERVQVPIYMLFIFAFYEMS